MLLSEAAASSEYTMYFDNFPKFTKLVHRQELKEGLTMHPNEAMDLGLPMAREGVARKIKWLTRRFLRSRCSLAPNTVKAKAECIVRIVATLILKFKDLKNDRNMEPTPFLAVKDKHVRRLT